MGNIVIKTILKSHQIATCWQGIVGQRLWQPVIAWVYCNDSVSVEIAKCTGFNLLSPLSISVIVLIVFDWRPSKSWPNHATWWITGMSNAKLVLNFLNLQHIDVKQSNRCLTYSYSIHLDILIKTFGGNDCRFFHRLKMLLAWAEH